MNQTNGTINLPKAWVDKNNVIVLRNGLDLEEAQELYEMLGQAFDSGLKSGYLQGLKAASA